MERRRRTENLTKVRILDNCAITRRQRKIFLDLHAETRNTRRHDAQIAQSLIMQNTEIFGKNIFCDIRTLTSVD